LRTVTGIGERLVISPFTAKTHVSRAMLKLRAPELAHFVVFADESGLVNPHAPAKDHRR
jgi:DNA-binding NarL/FixJ family response regulator